MGPLSPAHPAYGRLQPGGACPCPPPLPWVAEPHLELRQLREVPEAKHAAVWNHVLRPRRQLLRDGRRPVRQLALDDTNHQLPALHERRDLSCGRVSQVARWGQG